MRKKLAECLNKARNAVTDAELERIGTGGEMSFAEWDKIMVDTMIANGVTVQQWIPVTERLPDTFGVFIVAIREPCKERVGKDCADFDPFAKTWLPSMCWDKGYEVTHWMELPNPPKEVADA